MLVAGCTRAPEGPAMASPTSPSAAAPASLLGPTSVAPGGVSGTFDASFPARNESFDFRNQLETKYQTALGRSAAPTFVDREGEVVWTEEYMRYRANGCDHTAAVQRVFAQIDGQPAAQPCGAAAEGLVVFPPRTDSLDFRRLLEAKYQQSGRGASQSTVDAEGGVVWTQEYLRYRVNACDHPTAVQKVFTQVDGGPVTAVCYVPPCVFTISPQIHNVAASGGTFTATITRTSGQGSECSFGAESLSPWISLLSGTTGSGATTTLTYFIPPNFGAAQTGYIRVRWPNNSTVLDINQAAGNGVSFSLIDPLTAPGVATTTCLIKSAATPCTLTAVGGNFSANATFTWSINYQIGATISQIVTSRERSFTFTQTCGGPFATAAGTLIPLNVILVVTDGDISITRQTTLGGQAALSLRLFGC